MEIFVARQPIFDRHQRVAGYELFYRGKTATDSAQGASLYEMSQHVVVDAFLGMGIDRVTDGLPAYIKVSREMLLGDTLRLLPKEHVILVVMDTATPDTATVNACELLAHDGYRLALDHFVYSEQSAQLLPLAHVVKVDVRSSAGGQLAQVIQRLRQYPVKILAEKIENHTLREVCVGLGFDLFQGYRFSRPETLSRRDLAIEHMHVFGLMKELRNQDSTDAAIEEGFRRDVALSYKLLRMVNAASMGGREIWSIGHAIRILGRNALYRWLALLLLSAVGESGVETEIARAALLRARLCELLAGAAGVPRAGNSLFIVGLFSMLDMLLGAPMEELVARLELAPDVRDALLHRADFFGAMLALVEAYEVGCWEDVVSCCREVDVVPSDVARLYIEALVWVRESQALKTAA